MSTASATRSTKLLPRLPISSEKGNEILGFVLGAFVVLLFGSLLSHHPSDASWLHQTLDSENSRVRNFVGPFGAQLSALCFALLGLASFFLPVLLAFEAWARFTHRERSDVAGRGFGVGTILIFSPALLHLLLGSVTWRGVGVDAGGALGSVLSGLLVSKLNTGGAFVVLAAVLLVASSLVAQSTLKEMITAWRQQGAGVWQRGVLAWAQHSKRQRERNTRRRVLEHHAHGELNGPKPTLESEPLRRSQGLRVQRRGVDFEESGVIEPPAAREDIAARSVPAVVQAPSAKKLDLPLRVTAKKGEGHFAVRKVRLGAPSDHGMPISTGAGGGFRPAGDDAGGLPMGPSVSPASADSNEAFAPPSGVLPPAQPSAPAPAASGPVVRRVAAPSNPAPPNPVSDPTSPMSPPPPPAGSMPVAPTSPAAPQAAVPAPAVSATPTAKASAVQGFQPISRPAPPPLVSAGPPTGAVVQEDLGIEPEVPELPPVNLLCTEKPIRHSDESALVRRGEIIEESCKHFGVSGEIAGIGPGPVITVFEFQPAPGVKVSKVVNLQDDLALALKADSVRIDRIPGRSTMGMEVPNDKRSIIHLGQLLANDSFKKSKSVLSMALGVDIHGRPVYQDLATMPHLLVAGATGAGKSVGLQSMITSILYKANKDEVKFIFIDPKRVELGVYSEIPHLKTEVVVEPKKAANALRWAVSEMERRYRLLAEVHVRSIDIYNRAIRNPDERRRLTLHEGESEFDSADIKPLPYYVIIIDELADLMMVASSDVETSIARLAQMARAVGIHLIVATQRPSVDVLTGTIKANFPCRLAFATATRHDSRTILDQVGAEKLLGKGDALFMPPGTSRIMRLHGAYISEQETAALIRWLKRRGKPDLDPDVVKAPEEEAQSGGGGGGGDSDPLFEEAAKLVVRERQGSASFLQRRMRVGFSRAARLIDMLEADGLLGPAQGSKPRDVLVPVDFFDEISGHKDAVED